MTLDLVKAGAAAKISAGTTPLHLAASSWQAEVIPALIEAGANKCELPLQVVNTVFGDWVRIRERDQRGLACRHSPGDSYLPLDVAAL